VFITSFAALIALVVDASISVVSILFAANVTSSINLCKCVSKFASNAVLADSGSE
jgi:hypothetical protein